MPVKKKTAKSTSSSEETPTKVSKIVSNKKDKTTTKKGTIKESKESISSSGEMRKPQIKKVATETKRMNSKPKVVNNSPSKEKIKTSKIKVVKNSSSEESSKPPPIKKTVTGPKKVVNSSFEEEKSKPPPIKKTVTKPKKVISTEKKKTPVVKEEISSSEEIIKPKKKTLVVKEEISSSEETVQKDNTIKKTSKEESSKKSATEIERDIAVESSSSSEDEPIKKIPITYSPEASTSKTIRTPRKIITPINKKPAKTGKDLTSTDEKTNVSTKKSSNEIEGNIKEGDPISLDRNGKPIPGFVEYVNAFHLDEVGDIPKGLRKYLYIDKEGKLYRSYSDITSSEEEKEIEINWNNPEHVEFYRSLLNSEERGEKIPDKYIAALEEYKRKFPKKKSIISPGMKIRTYSSASSD